MKSKLLKYAQTSSLMDIEINTGNEVVKFNLHKEVKIDESFISRDLKTQPSYYGFLSMLHKGLLKLLMELKVREKKAYASAYLKHKRSINKDTNRPNSDDVAKQKAELDIRYLKSQKLVIAMNYNVSRVESCVRAFEQRASLLQTLSANRRKERE